MDRNRSETIFVAVSCSHCPNAIRNTNWNDSISLKKVEQNDLGMDFAKCEQHETESRRGKVKFQMSEPGDIVVIANARLGYYSQMFNAILQANAIYFQRRKKLFAITNLMSNIQERYKKKELSCFWIHPAQTSLW